MIFTILCPHCGTENIVLHSITICNCKCGKSFRVQIPKNRKIAQRIFDHLRSILKREARMKDMEKSLKLSRTELVRGLAYLIENRIVESKVSEKGYRLTRRYLDGRKPMPMVTFLEWTDNKGSFHRQRIISGGGIYPTRRLHVREPNQERVKKWFDEQFSKKPKDPLVTK